MQETGHLLEIAVWLSRQWVRAWSSVVVFSDNAASFAAVKELTDRHAALAARGNELQERLSTSGQAAQVRDLTCRRQQDQGVPLADDASWDCLLADDRQFI